MTEPKSTDSSSKSSSVSTEDPRMKQRYLETRVLFSDYDTQYQKKLISWAKDAIQAVPDRGVEKEDDFYQEIAALVKESLITSSEQIKWSILVGNAFKVQATAVKDTISFFAVGDIKFLIYRTPN